MPAEPDADDLAAVLFTSGATGPAKGVRYRHGQLAAQRDALAATYAITRRRPIGRRVRAVRAVRPCAGHHVDHSRCRRHQARHADRRRARRRLRLDRCDRRVRLAGRAGQRRPHRDRMSTVGWRRFDWCCRLVRPCPIATLRAIARALPERSAAHAVRHDRVPAGGRRLAGPDRRSGRGHRRVRRSPRAASAGDRSPSWASMRARPMTPVPVGDDRRGAGAHAVVVRRLRPAVAHRTRRTAHRCRRSLVAPIGRRRPHRRPGSAVDRGPFGARRPRSRRTDHSGTGRSRGRASRGHRPMRGRRCRARSAASSW